MEEILEQIKNEIDAIEEQQNNLKELEKNAEKLKEEEKQLQEEQNGIRDKESGFYKDLSEKIAEKHAEFIEVNNMRQDKDSEINELIFKAKGKIQREIESKKKYIDENRNADVKGIDLAKLKAEKEKIEREIELNNITREEFDTKSDAEKQEIRKAKENYLNNKHRLAEINPTIELIDTLDGKTPKDQFIELDNLNEEIEETFNRDHLDKRLDKEKLLNDMVSGRQKREQEKYNETIQEAMEEEKMKKIEQEEIEKEDIKRVEEEKRQRVVQAKIKEMEEAAARRKADEEAARRRAAEEEAVRKKAAEEAAAKRKAAEEIRKKSNEVNIVYSAKYDQLVVKNVGLNKNDIIERKDIKLITPLELAEKMSEPEEKFENLEQSTLIHLQLLKAYDERYGTSKAKEYLEIATKDTKTKQENAKEMQDSHINIHYNLKGLYDGDFTLEETQEILKVANQAKKKGTATVEKGFKVTMRELLDKIASKMKIGKFYPKEETLKLSQAKATEHEKQIDSNYEQANTKQKVEPKRKVSKRDAMKKFKDDMKSKTKGQQIDTKDLMERLERAANDAINRSEQDENINVNKGEERED